MNIAVATQKLETEHGILAPRTSSDRRRVLLIASGCDGSDSGEAWSSFQWVDRLAKYHDVTLLTYTKQGKSSAAFQLPHARVIEWPDAPVPAAWERFNSMLKPGYLSFYLRARSWIRRRLKAGEKFDLVHQISPLALRYPSPASGLGIPLIIGPLAGSLEVPTMFRDEFADSAWYTKLRNMDRWRLRHDPMLRRSYLRADLLIGVAPYVRGLLDDLISNDFEIMGETGVTHLPRINFARALGQPLRILYVGRVIRSKGVRDAICAVSRATDVRPLKFDILGDGDDLSACRKEAQSLGLGGIVAFHGWLPRASVDAFYSKADIFLFPSFCEPSGNAIIEAMSYGLPVIVADKGGPGFVVEDTCGIRVRVTDPADFASQMATAIRTLANAPEFARTLGAAAREKIRKYYVWDSKVSKMNELYRRVLARHA